jgi:hypothetical protein
MIRGKPYGSLTIRPDPAGVTAGTQRLAAAAIKERRRLAPFETPNACMAAFGIKGSVDPAECSVHFECCFLQHCSKPSMSAIAIMETTVSVTSTLTRDRMRVAHGLAQKRKLRCAWLIRNAVDLLFDRGEMLRVPFDLAKRS